ncbi:MAG: DUF4367 domain-containing protein [Oscillospiraceae bacterium]|jgi:hypothetical protein|nr:DUF4367 domain-containing protein [Oscillospiraceae bacterium]
MQGKYNNLTALELREMFLDNTLDTDLMEQDDFEKLFGYEIELGEPSADVISFCSNGLNEYEYYGKDIQMPPLSDIYKELERRTRRNRGRAFAKVTQVAASIVLVIALTALLAQGVAMALGFDLFGYIFNWFRPDTVEITNMEQQPDGSFDSPHLNATTTDTDPAEPDDGTEIEDEFVFLDFERIEDIDDEWLSRVSPWLVERYEFSSGDYISFFGEQKFEIYFLDENNDFISLLIQNLSMHYAEIDDEKLVEKITVNGITFKVFNNMEDFQVVWEFGEHLYRLNTFLPIETMKEIIRNYY